MTRKIQTLNAISKKGLSRLPDGYTVGNDVADPDAILVRSTVNPFLAVPDADASDALWVEPRLVGEVEFAEFTPNDTLRHARWRGLRPDMTPADVHRAP